MLRRLWGSAVAALSIQGCASIGVSYTYMNRPPHPLAVHAPDQVMVFSDSRPPQPFVEIGRIRARDIYNEAQSSRSALLDSLRREAARRGCEAIIIHDADESVESMQMGQSATLRGVVGSCIVFM